MTETVARFNPDEIPAYMLQSEFIQNQLENIADEADKTITIPIGRIGIFFIPQTENVASLDEFITLCKLADFLMLDDDILVKHTTKYVFELAMSPPHTYFPQIHTIRKLFDKIWWIHLASINDYYDNPSIYKHGCYRYWSVVDNVFADGFLTKQVVKYLNTHNKPIRNLLVIHEDCYKNYDGGVISTILSDEYLLCSIFKFL